MSLIDYQENPFEFGNVFRIIISGSSGAGKTHFVKQLLLSGLVPHVSRVIYHHPDAVQGSPVDWHESLASHNIEVVYRVGLPSLDQLEELEEFTVVVIDDLYEEAVNSKDICYLLRVLSRKRKIHVCLLAQQYYAKGTFAVQDRNCCTHHALLSSSDYGSNARVCAQFNLRTEFQTAEAFNHRTAYPYIFIARDSNSRVSGVSLFVDLFGKRLTAVVGRMVYYMLAKRDFDQLFERRDNHVAFLRPTKTKKNYGKKKDRHTASTLEFSSQRQVSDSDKRSANTSSAAVPRDTSSQSIGSVGSSSSVSVFDSSASTIGGGPISAASRRKERRARRFRIDN